MPTLPSTHHGDERLEDYFHFLFRRGVGRGGDVFAPNWAKHRKNIANKSGACGYGRGSRDLGIPTANVSRKDLSCSCGDFDHLKTGIYYGFARIIIMDDGDESTDSNVRAEMKAPMTPITVAMSQSLGKYSLRQYR